MVLNPTEGDRVRANTVPEVNRRIDEQIERNIRHYSGQTKEEIYRRIRELDQEWDFERSRNDGIFGLAYRSCAWVDSR